MNTASPTTRTGCPPALLEVVPAATRQRGVRQLRRHLAAEHPVVRGRTTEAQDIVAVERLQPRVPTERIRIVEDDLYTVVLHCPRRRQRHDQVDIVAPPNLEDSDVVGHGEPLRSPSHQMSCVVKLAALPATERARSSPNRRTRPLSSWRSTAVTVPSLRSSSAAVARSESPSANVRGPGLHPELRVDVQADLRAGLRVAEGEERPRLPEADLHDEASLQRLGPYGHPASSSERPGVVPPHGVSRGSVRRCTASRRDILSRPATEAFAAFMLRWHGRIPAGALPGADRLPRSLCRVYEAFGTAPAAFLLNRLLAPADVVDEDEFTVFYVEEQAVDLWGIASQDLDDATRQCGAARTSPANHG